MSRQAASGVDDIVRAVRKGGFIEQYSHGLHWKPHQSTNGPFGVSYRALGGHLDE